MHSRRISPLLACLIAAVIVHASLARADEGMWLFNHPPQEAAEGEIRLRAHRRLARRTCSSRPCGSTTAAPARSSRPTDW